MEQQTYEGKLLALVAEQYIQSHIFEELDIEELLEFIKTNINTTALFDSVVINELDESNGFKGYRILFSVIGSNVVRVLDITITPTGDIPTE